ncbi:transcription elongation factor TFIIS [Eutrema salsugineum]|uniref:transcription elongation factor TFIIS n=1 Tax=Eutrema salsugineum TaxID=72664 RepID=UPI000CED7919|nr:transcription elongation factor TFIIS [Eutrema salsugineum]
MQKQEFLELFEAATRAAKAARGGENSTAVSRCLDAMKRLKKAPESLVCDLIIKTSSSIGENHSLFTEHKNTQIRSEAKLLYTLWLSYLYATGRKQNRPPVVKKKRVEISTTGDSKRDKVREILQTSLSKVANEVVAETEMKKRVVSCDPWTVAVSVETAISILFNMGDSNNPDLRRKVLLGEINGERLVTMDKEELGSDKIQKEVQQIKEKARFREENRLKMMMLQSDHMIMI